MTSLKQLIGQLSVFGFDGLSVPSYIRRLISEEKLSGVILFKRNIESKEQLIELIRELKSIKKKYPLLISVDHEGGRVFRLPPPFTQIPTAREIAQRSPAPIKGERKSNAFQIGSLMGRELREVGFNLNYAPVLDVDTNPINPIIGDRSFSSDPEIVAMSGLDLVEGLRAEKIIPCGKHFPGHGDTSKDSHLDLPVVDLPLSRLEKIELIPFIAAIEHQIEMLMTAHVLYPQIDADYPATLSKKILTDLLRKKLRYEGVIISDDFLMKAIADRYGLGEAAKLFLEAGGDLLLICREEAAQVQVIDFIEKSIKDKLLNIQLLETSLQRVLRLKAQI